MQMIVDLTVADVKVSAEFYARVGYDVPEVWERDGETQHVEIPGGPMINSLAVTRAYDKTWPDAAGVVLIVPLDSREAVDAKYSELTEGGYSSYLAPFDAFWGARYAIIDDPDGNHVGIMSPSDGPHEEVPGVQ